MAKTSGTTKYAGSGSSSATRTAAQSSSLADKVESAWGGKSGTAQIANEIRSTFGTMNEYQLDKLSGGDNYTTYTISRSSTGTYSLRENQGPMKSSILESYSSLEAAINGAKQRKLVPKGKVSPSGLFT